jgi:hypothetical protein
MSKPLRTGLNNLMIKDVPSYGNKFFYSLGFLSMISLVILVATGLAMVFFGPNWWLMNNVGSYTRSVHMWATQAFVIFVILHLLIVFLTSGFKKPRRLTWILGVLMMFVVLAETEFGYVLRGDFYNGSGLGLVINPLDYGQIYGVHIALIPFAIVSLLFLHYLLVRVLGIAKPYRKDVSVKTVPADHGLLFARGGGLIVLIMVLAFFLPSPFIKPTTIQSVAQDDAYKTSQTLMAEFNKSSDTATYIDNIAPYTYDTRAIYIDAPYQNWLLTQSKNAPDQLKLYNNEPAALQAKQLHAATDYYANDRATGTMPINPVTSIVAGLTTMAEAGLYEPALAIPSGSGRFADGTTYGVRFLADTGVLNDKAQALNITTAQYGMIREESGHAPGAWWLAPIGLLNKTVLANDDNGDRDAAIIFGSLMLTMMAFPFIPYLNQLPDKLRIYRLIWREKKS